MTDLPIPDPGPIGWATLGAIILKAVDLVLKWRSTETPFDRRAGAVLDDSTAIRSELRAAEAGLRAELAAQEDRHQAKIAALQAAIDEERKRRFQAEDELAKTKAELAGALTRLDLAVAEIADLKGESNARKSLDR
jgi:chromosome segregation ATPase